MTDTKQPEALRLAVIHEFLAEQSKHDEEKTIIVQLFKNSATELRRLHSINAELLEALKEAVNLTYRSPSCQIGIINPCKCHDCIANRAREAIAKAEVTK
jgi:hypothetical protein